MRDLKALEANSECVLQQYVSSESGAENKELDSLNQVLNEITLFLQHQESFTRFFVGKTRDSWSFNSARVSDDQQYQSQSIPQEMVVVMKTIRQEGSQLPAGNKLESFAVAVVCDNDT